MPLTHPTAWSTMRAESQVFYGILIAGQGVIGFDDLVEWRGHVGRLRFWFSISRVEGAELPVLAPQPKTLFGRAVAKSGTYHSTTSNNTCRAIKGTAPR